MEIEELSSLTIDWLFNIHFKKHKKVQSHEIMCMLMQFERNPIKRIYATRIVECSELLNMEDECEAQNEKSNY